MKPTQASKMFYSACKAAETCEGTVMFNIIIHGVIDYCVAKTRSTCFWHRHGKTREPLLHYGSWTEALQQYGPGAAQQTTVKEHQTHMMVPGLFLWNDFVFNRVFVSRD